VNAEDCNHLFVHCRYTQQVWGRLRSWSNAAFPIPGEDHHTTEEWWLEARRRAPKRRRRDFDTITILVHWRIWKERNTRIFQLEGSTVDRLFELIIEDVRSWRAAGCIISFY
jgi:hypothetical protein